MSIGNKVIRVDAEVYIGDVLDELRNEDWVALLKCASDEQLKKAGLARAATDVETHTPLEQHIELTRAARAKQGDA